MLLINPVCSYRWLRPSLVAVESGQHSQTGLMAGRRIFSLLCSPPMGAQLLCQGC